MTDTDLAAAKTKAVCSYLEKRLGKGGFWECGTDLDKDIDLYLPNADSEGNYGSVYIPLTEITLHNGELDFNSEKKIETILKDRSL